MNTMPKRSVKSVNKHLEDLELGTQFALGTGTVAVLLEKGIGSCKVFVISQPPSRDFLLRDGSKDPYWYGTQAWGPQTVVKEEYER